MAKIGLSKPYFAKYTANGNTVTYSDGTLLGRATSLTMDLENADTNVLYADNGIAESANSFSGGSITIGTDEISAEALVTAFGVKEVEISDESVTTSGAKWLVFDDEQEIPYGGFAGIIKKQINGATKYVAIVYPKIQLQNLNDAATTQGETIEWQTEEISATLMRDDTENHEWRRISTPLDKETEAEAAIKKFFNIAE